MDLEKKASFKHEDLVKQLQIDVEKNLEPELDRNKVCIYKVPKLIRRLNEEVYTPQLISIGPFHHGKQELANMEKTKRRYMKSFLHRITTKKQEEILSFVEDQEDNIRSCYAETSELESLEYVMMILYDAIFIIELFRKVETHADRSDSFLSIGTVRCTVCVDLQLLENQLPFFVLDRIFKLAFDDSCGPTFMELSQSFFKDVPNLALITPQLPIEHFTDWKRYTLLENYPKSGEANDWIIDLPCARKLHESGVKFKKIEGEDKLLRFGKRKHKIPFFEVYELQLPHVLVDEATEYLLGNVMALEQCHYQRDTHVSNYIQLMDFLIDTEKDVDLLVENGILSIYAGDNATTANMFNKLCRYTASSQSSYYDMCEELKKHYNNPWNNTKATLRKVYFSNLWRGTGTVAAVVLLLLTIIQTICSILQFVRFS